jgi:hypothetical protein
VIETVRPGPGVGALLLLAWLSTCPVLASACGPAQVPLADCRSIADKLAAMKIAEQQAALQTGRPALRLDLGQYEVNVGERNSGDQPGYTFFYVHRRPSIGLGPGQAHFTIWVSRLDGQSLYLPGK